MPNLETDLDAKIALARSSTIPTEVLNRLAYDHYEEIRRLIAFNIKTSKEVLLSLSEDHTDVVYQGAIYTLAQIKTYLRS